MKPPMRKLTLSLATILTLGATTVQAENILQNGSFEDFTVLKAKKNWKKVQLTNWNEITKTNSRGKTATDGSVKIALDSDKSLNLLTQTISTIEGALYTFSVEAYAAKKQLSTAEFEMIVDSEVIETFTPTREWKTYTVTFEGNGQEQSVGFREIASQNNNKGVFLDNAMVEITKVDNHPPAIEGVAKVSTAMYNAYTFIPNASDIDGDNLTFSVENKPTWAEFNTTTGVLSGTPIPLTTTLGTSADIKITVSDGKLSTSLAPFSVEVTEAVEIAEAYGKATQPAKDGYRWYQSPDRMIDGDNSTSNHTEGTAEKNWVQIELPSPTKVYKLMIQGRTANSSRLSEASVYLSNTPYNGTLNESQKVGTLQGNANKQYIEFPKGKSGTYVIIKGKDDRNIHLVTVEAYGSMPDAPMFTSSDYNSSISKWQNKIEAILNVEVKDYQKDVLTYSIEGDVPFEVDANGNVRVNDVLTEDAYTFSVVVSDGVNSTTQKLNIAINNSTDVKKTFRSNDSTPELSGYVPNTYNDGDTLTVTIAGVPYEATVNFDGTWTILDDEIGTALTVGTHDVSLSVNGGEAIVYEEYFEVYGSMLQASTHSLSMETIEDIEVSVASHTVTPLVKDERVRGSSVTFKVENGVLTLENKSYRKIKSLLGKYQDANGKDILVKLDFSENILPYSTNVLNTFDHATEMNIVHTAGHFDMELSFGGKDCDASTPTDKTIYCTPTSLNDEVYSEHSGQNNTDLSEQQVYSVAMATYSHLYNSVDGLNSMKAWVEGTKYKGLDYTGSYQSSESYLEFEDDKLAYLNEKYFRVTMPNNHVKYSSMRFQYAAEGMGGGFGGNLLGTKSGGHFASAWEGSLDIGKKGTGIYNTIHHEMAHAIGFGHSSGMSYGWSHALQQVVQKFYTIGENPVVDVPNYVFESKALGNGKIQVTVHKTSDASEDEVRIELLSGTAVTNDKYSVAQSDNDESNQVTVTLNDELLTRFFIRVYGADSDELMSKMIVPSDLIGTTLLASDANASKEYHAITHENWEKGAKALNLTLKTNDAQSVCKLWLGTTASIAYQVDADRLNSNYRTAIDGADWLASKKLLARRGVWYQYLAYDYSDGAYATSWKNYNQLVNDDTLGILCVKPVK